MANPYGPYGTGNMLGAGFTNSDDEPTVALGQSSFGTDDSTWVYVVADVPVAPGNHVEIDDDFHIISVGGGPYVSSAIFATGSYGWIARAGSVTPPVDTVPSAFAPGQWTLTDAAIGGTLTVTISALPSDGGSPITAIEYRVNGGTWTNSGISDIGDFVIPGLTDDVAVNVEIQAVNAIGPGDPSDTKSATPTGVAPAEIPWTSQMGQPKILVEMGDSSFLKADGNPAVVGDRVQTMTGLGTGNLTAAANGGTAAADANRPILGASRTFGSVTGPVLQFNTGAELGNRLIGEAGSLSMPSGLAGDIEVILAEYNPGATAANKTLLGNSSGNFASDVLISTTVAAGQLCAVAPAGAVKIDTTTRVELIVVEKVVVAGNTRALRLNDTETLGPNGGGASVAATGQRPVVGNVWGGSQGANITALLSYAVFPANTPRDTIRRHCARVLRKFGQAALIQAGSPYKLADATVPAGTTNTRMDMAIALVDKQTWSHGFLAEMQADSFYGGAVPLPTDNWAYPRDFTAPMMAAFKAKYLPGGGYGFHGCRFPMDGFAFRGPREVDGVTGLIKKTGFRNSGIGESLAEFFANVVDEGGGLYPEHWGFPPYFKTRVFTEPQWGYGTISAGGSYADTVSLESIRVSDPTQWAARIAEITDYMVDVLEYLHGYVPVRGYGWFNEAGNGASAVYGTCHIGDELTYAQIIKRSIEKIRASAVLSTWNGQPNNLLLYINNWDGIATSGSMGFSLPTDTEVLATGKTVWQEIGTATDHSITANGADADVGKSATKRTNLGAMPLSQNEMEHFNQYTTVGDPAYKTPQWRAMNLVLKTANYIRVQGAIFDVPIIHFVKPIGQDDVDSNTIGYGLTQTRLPAPFGQDPSTPGDPHPEIGYGEWADIPDNARGVQALLHLKKGSKIRDLDFGIPVPSGVQGFGWITDDDKEGRLIVNRTASAYPTAQSFPEQKTLRHYRYSYDAGEENLGLVTTSRVPNSLPAYSCEVVIEQ